MSTTKKIALFGGSFDPVHTDHLNIAKACYSDLGFEEVWLIPTYLNPFKSQQNSSNSDRLAMLNLLIKDYDFLKINTHEIDQPHASYTYHTVKYFLDLYDDQDVEFAFIMGSDQLDRFESWDQFDELIQMIKFKVFLRSDDYNHEVVDKYHLEVFNFNRLGLSSTDIRNLKHLDLQVPAINDYVNYHLLYLSERLEAQMDNDRYLHCLNVGQMAHDLATHHHLDTKKALIAGTLHDVAKQWEKPKLQQYLAKWAPDLLTEPSQVWHSFVGGLHLKHDWIMGDEEIIQAVFNHTVGKQNMSLLDKIVFCADKISSERNYDGVKEFRELCFKDLNQGFKTLLKNQYDQVVSKNQNHEVGERLAKTYQYYIKEGKN